MSTKTITPTERLEELRAALRAENISYGELAELESLAIHIHPSDVELLEPAGVPEGVTPQAWVTYSQNLATVQGWVHQASGGFLTAEPTTCLGQDRLSLGRRDGEAFGADPRFGGTSTTGLLVGDIYIPSYRKLDRRNKVTIRAVLRAVYNAFKEIETIGGELPEDWYGPYDNTRASFGISPGDTWKD